MSAETVLRRVSRDEEQWAASKRARQGVEQ